MLIEQSHKSGFTLVELSIVIVIIGLLIGGILVGTSLVESAKATRLVKDISQYEVAVVQFNNKFRKYPGDSSYFKPTGAPDDILNYGDTNSDGIINYTLCNGALSNDERYQTWGHLSQAGMLSKTYLPYSPSSCPSGIYAYSYQNSALAGVVWPYTELNAVAQAAFSQRYVPIYTLKWFSGAYFAFQLTVNPLDALALESKMGVKAYTGASDEAGLKNAGLGIGKCFVDVAEHNPTVDCTANTALFGKLYYFIAP